MKIEKIDISKFRSFRNVSFDLGKQLTVIAWLNGTQKTTLLWMLSQPFSITDTENPMIKEIPLCGWSFRSAFSEKFRISHEVHDKAWEHEWTLHFDTSEEPYVVESIKRGGDSNQIRFWRKWNKSKGSWYIQLPVIYLSLKRLIPIGEDGALKENQAIQLSEDEMRFYAEWHNKILFLTRTKDAILSSNILTSKDKQTLWVNTSYYDWQTNSAWQDNLGKILLAIISFRRLKNTYWDNYRWGLLVIDEIDTTFYPGSQVKLIDALIHFAAKFDIQIFFTTHSLSILEKVSEFSDKPARKKDIRLVYLKREDDSIAVVENPTFSHIKNHLNRKITWKDQNAKIDVYSEDEEARHFLKFLLWTSVTKYLNFVDVNLGCSNLIELSQQKVPSFIAPNSIIVFDWDVKGDANKYKKVRKMKNAICLPTNQPPEKILAQFLSEADDVHPVWNEVDATFDHWVCFWEYPNSEIQNGNDGRRAREVAKSWYRTHIPIWWRNACKVWKYWKEKNLDEANAFKSEFETLLKNLTDK